MLRNSISILSMLFLFLSGISQAYAQDAPPAGTEIPNKAQVRYFDPVFSDTLTVVSNTVKAIVQAFDGPLIEMSKQIVQRNMEQGDLLTFRIDGSNSGDAPAQPVSITVDGIERQYVVWSDGIPANTVLNSVLDASGGQVLYHRYQDAGDVYVSAIPSELKEVDKIGIVFNRLDAGVSFSVSFDVLINQNASGPITNTSDMSFGGIDNKQTTTFSNEVTMSLPERMPTLAYYRDDNYDNKTNTAVIGSPLFLQADAASCNRQAGRIDTTIIQIRSSLTEDEEFYKAVETDANTGMFRVFPHISTADASVNTVVQANQVMEITEDDNLVARLTECSAQSRTVTANVQISPFGVVFDSQNNQPVEGATVVLIDVTGEGNGGNAGGPAVVFDESGNREVSNQHLTGEDGKFKYPYLKASTYRVEVITPTGYFFASDVPPEELSDNRVIERNASYGQEFTIQEDATATDFDIPLDPDPSGVLFVAKSGDRKIVEIGDFANYQVEVQNNSSQVVTNVRVEDTLPFGFKYQEGTARVNGSSVSDPEGGKGPVLSFDIGEIPASSSTTLSYRVLVGAGALNGDGINTAVAIADEALQKVSNRGTHKAEVRGGVFTDEGYIIGKVFMDCNKNDVQDKGEPGIPGVRLYLENGNFVITDVEGTYTFFGIKPNKHVLKLDNYSLPEGSELAEPDNRHAGDPSSRFVDLKKGELHRADFAICNCEASLHEEIEQRKGQLAEVSDELGTSVKRDLRTEETARSGYSKREQASGTIGGTGISKFKTRREALQAQNREFAGRSIQPEEHTLEEVMIHEKVELGFIGLTDGDTLNAGQQKIWMKSRLGADLQFRVNGEQIDAKKISKQSRLPELELQAFEYIGIELNKGINLLAVTETDPFGNVRGEKEIAVYVPGKVEHIELSVPVNEVPADGASSAVVRVRLVDDSGVPVTTKIPVTLDVSAGEWQVEDNDPNTPGTQTFVENGEIHFELKSTIEPGDVQVRVSIGVLEAGTTVIFLPDLRPLLAAGIIEGTIRLNSPASMVPARNADGFERELKALSYGTGNTTADARAAFFLKGKIKGDYLLTASFDSEKDDNERLFRDIQPDEFYPVYGESSVKGYDAQSTGRLYVRIDKKRSYALYGDLITQDRHPAKSLGAYNRTQTGFKGHYETNKMRFNVFGSNATSLQRIEEFRALGISGPYELRFDNILINSEQVEIIIRDRNQPSVIISEERLSRFRDYVIEPFTGNIIFKAPVPGLDQDLNPMFIRVTYEVEDGAGSYVVGGFDGQYKLTNNLELGASFVEDRNPENEYRLKSANTTVKLSENTTLIGEVAESTTGLEGDGRGGRIELQHRGSKVTARVYAGKTDADFMNRSATLGRARTEAGANTTVKVDSKTNLRGEFLYTGNDTSDVGTTGALVNVQRRINEDLRVEMGVRHSWQEQGSTQNQGDDKIINTNLRGKITASVPKVKSATVFGEYEQDVNKLDRKVIAAGGDYRIKNRGKIYARHEFISSAQGRYALNSNVQRHNTVIGLDANYMKNGKVFSEYRVADAFDGQNAQAAIGLRNRFMVREGFGINAGFERVFSVMGEPLNDGTAISASVDYTANPLWKGTARAEARFGENGNIYLNTLGYGRKLSSDWTFLAKNVFALSTSANEGVSDKIQERLRLGVAYRQTETNRLDGLGRYELKYEQNDQFSEGFDRLVHIFSTHVNYHPTADWTFSGRAAAKKVTETYDELDSRSITSLLSARAMYDITRRLDGGVNLSMLGNDGFKTRDYGLGAEVGFIAQRNLRLAVGFNLFGFSDKDLSESNYTRKGVYIGFSYKFDERLFKGLMPDGNTETPEVYGTCGECTIQKLELNTLPKPDMSFELQPVELKAPEFNQEVLRKPKKLPREIHFAFDQTRIDEKSARMLDLVADYLQDDESYDLEIRGYTDRSGSNEYNLKLSGRRANAVRTYLVAAGVDPEKVKFKGLSFRDSTGTNEKDIVDRSKNRKVELSLNSKKREVLFVPQVQDLKIEQQITPAVSGWDFVFNPQYSAVPAWIHFEAGTARMNAVTRYLLDRIVLALTDHPDVNIILQIPKSADDNGLAKNRTQVLFSYITQAGISPDRLHIETVIPSSADNLADRRVHLMYEGANSNLLEIRHEDDVTLPEDEKVLNVLKHMIETLKGREDKSLIENRNLLGQN